jgi:hypothetical protein
MISFALSLASGQPLNSGVRLLLPLGTELLVAKSVIHPKNASLLILMKP